MRISDTWSNLIFQWNSNLNAAYENWNRDPKVPKRPRNVIFHGDRVQKGEWLWNDPIHSCVSGEANRSPKNNFRSHSWRLIVSVQMSFCLVARDEWLWLSSIAYFAIFRAWDSQISFFASLLLPSSFVVNSSHHIWLGSIAQCLSSFSELGYLALVRLNLSQAIS